MCPYDNEGYIVDFDGDGTFRLADASFVARVWKDGGKGGVVWNSPPCWGADFDGDGSFRLADSAFIARVWRGTARWRSDKLDRRAMRSLEGDAAPMWGILTGRKQKQTMQIYAYSSTSKVIDAVNALSWSSVEVAFLNGEIESVAAEHGLVPQIQADRRSVGLTDLFGSRLAFPAGLTMTVTFTAGTDMRDVGIDFASDKTAIVHPNPLTHPTVTWNGIKPPVASVVGMPGAPTDAATPPSMLPSPLLSKPPSHPPSSSKSAPASSTAPLPLLSTSPSRPPPSPSVPIPVVGTRIDADLDVAIGVGVGVGIPMLLLAMMALMYMKKAAGKPLLMATGKAGAMPAQSVAVESDKLETA